MENAEVTAEREVPPGLPEPPLFLFYEDMANRTFWLEDMTGGAGDIMKGIIAINRGDMGTPAAERRPIKILINSEGGDAETAHMLIDAIELSETPVTCVNMGKAYSGACLVFLAGHYRLALPHSEFMIHDGGGDSCGDYASSKLEMDRWDGIIRQHRDYIADCTLITPEMLDAKTGNVEDRTGKDWFISAAEAKELRLSDRTARSLDEVIG